MRRGKNTQNKKKQNHLQMDVAPWCYKWVDRIGWELIEYIQLIPIQSYPPTYSTTVQHPSVDGFASFYFVCFFLFSYLFPKLSVTDGRCEARC